MTKWIMSANPLIFDHKLAFDMNGFIDWNQTRKFTVGDIVYIYILLNQFQKFNLKRMLKR